MTNAEAFNVLGLTGAPTAAEIKSAYRTACKRSHPDAGGTADAFKRVCDAYAILTGAAQPTAPTAASQPKRPAPKARFKTREEWLLAACAAIRREMKLAGLTVPAFKLSVGFGKGGTRKMWSVIAGSETADGVAQVYVSPLQDQPEDAISNVCYAVAAGMTFATADDRKLYDAVVGFAVPAILLEVGIYPHSAVSEKVKKTAGTRLLKIACPSCGYTARTTAKWVAYGLPKCCCGTKFVAA